MTLCEIRSSGVQSVDENVRRGRELKGINHLVQGRNEVNVLVNNIEYLAIHDQAALDVDRRDWSVVGCKATLLIWHLTGVRIRNRYPLRAVACFLSPIEFLEKAAKLKPDDHTTQVNLGNAYFDAGRYDQAEKTYTAVLAKKPDDADVRTDLGLTFAARPQADYDRAIAEFEKVLEKKPTHTLALQNVIVAYTKKGDAAKATATLAKLEAADATNASIAKLREEIGKISKN